MTIKELSSAISMLFLPIMLVIIGSASVLGVCFSVQLGLSPETVADLKGFIKDIFAASMAFAAAGQPGEQS